MARSPTTGNGIRPVQRVRRVLRAALKDGQVGGLLAASVLVLSQIERPGSGGPSLPLDVVVAVGAALSGKRLVAGSIIAGGGLSAWLLVTWEPPTLGAAGVLVVVMAAVAQGQFRTGFWLTSWYLSVMMIAITRWIGQDPSVALFNAGFLMVAFGLAWAIGWVIHRRGVEVGEVTERYQARLEKQRLELARDLHDTLAQNVTGMVVTAEGIRARLGADCPDDVVRDIEQTLRLGRQSIADLRGMMRVLRSTHTGDEVSSGWTPLPVMQALAEQVACLKEQGFTVSVIAEGNPDVLPPSLRSCLSKLIIEATTNMVKHAAPGGHCSIMIDMDETGVEAIFTNPRSSRAVYASDGGLGLVGAAERVRLLGGELTARESDTQWVLTFTIATSGHMEHQP